MFVTQIPGFSLLPACEMQTLGGGGGGLYGNVSLIMF